MPPAIAWSEVDADVRAQLGGLDLSVNRARVERFAAEIAAGRLGAAANRLTVDPEPPGAADVVELAELPAGERAELARAGEAALEAGEVAVAVLNGGMATRFGGSVKGIVCAIDPWSFLEIKRAQSRRSPDVPFLVMNSFATDRATREFVRERGLDGGLRCFLQAVSLRLTPAGELFRDPEGHVSLYAPGHGDFPEALRSSGLQGELARAGVRTLLLSNVDNLGADPDPAVIGFHLAAGRAMTVETARTIPGDVGGAPARVDGRLQLVEGFRFPEGFDFDRLPYVNTNTFAFSLDALADEHPLSWFYVEKSVAGRAAIQMEHLVGELSRFVDTAYVGIARSGTQSRYYPVKTREDLEALRADPDLVARFTADLVAAPGT
jgi:UTP--glucose-1-phosphate uridylyltransferase